MQQHTCGKTSDQPVTDQCADTCGVVMPTPNELKLAEELAGGHYACDDGWYSCPLSEGGCFDDREEGCNCGREDRVASIAQALTSYGKKCAAEAVAECVAAVENTLDVKREKIYRWTVVSAWNTCRMKAVHALRLVAAKYEGGK